MLRKNQWMNQWQQQRSKSQSDMSNKGWLTSWLNKAPAGPGVTITETPKTSE